MLGALLSGTLGRKCGRELWAPKGSILQAVAVPVRGGSGVMSGERLGQFPVVVSV